MKYFCKETAFVGLGLHGAVSTPEVGCILQAPVEGEQRGTGKLTAIISPNLPRQHRKKAPDNNR